MDSVAKDSYKWEDSPGLYHGCAVCGTSLNSPKAIRTCHGTHSEPCMRYHQTMFHKGESHKCDPCRKSNEVHDKRHREIALVIQQLKALDEKPRFGEVTPKASRAPSMTADSLRRNTFTRTPSNHFRKSFLEQRAHSIQRECLIKRARQMSEAQKGTAENGEPSHSGRRPSEWKAATVFEEDEEDGSTTTIPGFRGNNRKASVAFMLPPSTPAKLKREEKKAFKHAKSTDKALRRQSTNTVTIVSNNEVAYINNALHGSCKALASMGPEEALQSFIRTVILQQEIEAQKEQISVGDQQKSNGCEALITARLKIPFVQNALQKLGVQAQKKATKEQQTMILRLIELVLQDIELLANEARETLKRAGGYWRFANKRTYHAMIENNKGIDWQTGEKIAEDSSSSDE